MNGATNSRGRPPAADGPTEDDLEFFQLLEEDPRDALGPEVLHACLGDESAPEDQVRALWARVAPAARDWCRSESASRDAPKTCQSVVTGLRLYALMLYYRAARNELGPPPLPAGTEPSPNDRACADRYRERKARVELRYLSPILALCREAFLEKLLPQIADWAGRAGSPLGHEDLKSVAEAKIEEVSWKFNPGRSVPQAFFFKCVARSCGQQLGKSGCLGHCRRIMIEAT